jgi:hypothetical protein
MTKLFYSKLVSTLEASGSNCHVPDITVVASFLPHESDAFNVSEATWVDQTEKGPT